MSWSNREIIDYGRNLLGAWKKRNAEILSCFDLERLQERMQAYADLEMGASVMHELSEASNQHRDADAVAAVWFKVYNESFITLYDRGLANLIVVDAIPEAAQAQLDAMAAEVKASTRSDIRRVSTSALIAELQRRPDSRGLIEAIAESQRS
jgi:hypothetical protein